MPPVAAMAEALTAARLSGLALPTFPGRVPTSLNEAYRIQDAAIRRMPHPVAGWKVAALPPSVVGEFGVERIAGPIFATSVYAHPASVSLPGNAMRGVEAEFGICLATALPARDREYAEAEAVAAIASVNAAIEVVDSCVRDIVSLGVCAIVADLGINGAFVHGPAVEGWRKRDLSRSAVTLRLGTDVVATGHCGVPGGPIGALKWLVNHLSGRRIGLNAGDWISTGACLGMYAAGVGERATADFGDLGVVSVEFPAPGDPQV